MVRVRFTVMVLQCSLKLDVCLHVVSGFLLPLGFSVLVIVCTLL